MSKDFLVWQQDNVPGMATLLGIENFDDTNDLRYGRPVEANFPEDATFRFDPDFKRDTLLTDTLANVDRLVIASAKLVEVLKKQKVSDVEYLPVTVLDHKKKPVKDPYVIVHPLNHVACLDLTASKAKMSKLKKTTASSIKKLVLVDKQLPAARNLFRVAEYPKLLLVRRPLAEAIDATSPVGIRWVEVKDYEEG